MRTRSPDITEQANLAESQLAAIVDASDDGIITQVIFGERTPKEDREWVFEWLRLSNCKAATKRVRFSGAVARLHVETYREEDEW